MRSSLLTFLCLTLAASAHAQGSYLVGPGDVLAVSIRASGGGEGVGSDQDLQVPSDGHIDVVSVGRVKVAGMPTSSISDEIRRRLREGGIFNKPTVAVNVSEYGSQPVSVQGAVSQPLLHYLSGPTTLTEMLALAGGIDAEKAGPAIQVRRHAGEIVSISRDVLFGPDPQAARRADLSIQSRDTIDVPHADRFCISGSVDKPDCYPLEEGTHLMTALALAGGFRKDSPPPRKLTILRAQGQRRIPVQLKELESNDAWPPEILPGDVIVAPFIRDKVTVGGHVTTPGRYDWEEGMTVSDAVMVAGGVETDIFPGNLKKVHLTRGSQLTVINVQDIVRSGNPDVPLEPGDRIFVPKRKI
ncbi:MAG: SLBB domain-containing protein [Acidobacteriota bacterium]